ncbi:MAG: glycosyltransferase involved in cell wall biosynthesis, partial [Sulfurimonas sp.]|uniref:glycosyltransferase family 4 protein n=1 Tax=Sulfurimonas sp. TaxID=2022749 RepID=UPI0039E23867
AYIYQSAQTLTSQYHVENILLYNVNSRIDYKYSEVFSFASVLVDLKQQVRLIKPDVIYVHQVSSTQVLQQLSELKVPVVGFIHDHKNFCLREHKYTTIGNHTCTKKVGLGCYSCLGFINKKDSFPYVSFNNITNTLAIQDILKNFNHIIVASEYMKNHLLLHNFKYENISKITLFSTPINNHNYSSNITQTKRFLFVGQLVRGKGIDTLLDAFKKLNQEDTILDICGEGKQRVELEKRAKALGISHQVFFHGKIASDELSRYYWNAYAVVIPSRAPETFNLVGLEAMKHSKAVIATNVGGITEWLEDGLTGHLFTSNDSQGLSEILEYAIDNPQNISRMGQRGYQEYKTKFTATLHCHQLYNQLSMLIQKDTYHVA